LKDKANANIVLLKKNKDIKKAMSCKVAMLLGVSKNNPGNHVDLYTNNLKDLINQISDEKIKAIMNK
jgi:hypothetical protein